ncbi:MAG TPA: PH domain-containing protein [Pirellulales bacterium]|nr:PH domain-containing protein [Pirellulales bacterium]
MSRRWLSMTFSSKKDVWLMVVLFATTAMQLVAGVAVINASGPTWAGAALFGSAGLIVWLVASTYYVVENDMITVHCGPFRWRIALDEIDEISPTHNPLSSPALSLDRLWIAYRRRGRRRAVMISPSDQHLFLETIARARPSLELVGDRLRRRVA